MSKNITLVVLLTFSGENVIQGINQFLPKAMNITLGHMYAEHYFLSLPLIS